MRLFKITILAMKTVKAKKGYISIGVK